MRKFILVIISAFFVSTLFAQDSLVRQKACREITLKNGEQMVFTKPKLFKQLGHIPNDIWYMAKSPFKKSDFSTCFLPY